VIVEGEVKKLKEGEEVIGSIYLRVLLLWLRLESIFIGLCINFWIFLFLLKHYFISMGEDGNRNLLKSNRKVEFKKLNDTK
jgi:hypothetical protein